MKLTAEVKRRVIAEIKKNIDDANKFYPDQNFKMPSIVFAKRGTTAGTANGSKWEVDFNATLLMENQEDFIARTVPHEVAHLIDYRVNPENHNPEPRMTARGWRRGKRNVHGADFKFIMERVLGADDSTRCHNYNTTNAKVKRAPRASFLYQCTCGCKKEVTMGAKRHAKEQAWPGTYFMRGHGQANMRWMGAPLAVAASEPKAKTASSHKRPTTKSTGSKKDLARAVFKNHPARGDFIKHCVDEMGMKKVTASTYHHNFKSGKWS